MAGLSNNRDKSAIVMAARELHTNRGRDVLYIEGLDHWRDGVCVSLASTHELKAEVASCPRRYRWV